MPVSAPCRQTDCSANGGLFAVQGIMIGGCGGMGSMVIGGMAAAGADACWMTMTTPGACCPSPGRWCWSATSLICSSTLMLATLAMSFLLPSARASNRCRLRALRAIGKPGAGGCVLALEAFPDHGIQGGFQFAGDGIAARPSGDGGGLAGGGDARDQGPGHGVTTRIGAGGASVRSMT
jgi:hypothetical protein